MERNIVVVKNDFEALTHVMDEILSEGITKETGTLSMIFTMKNLYIQNEEDNLVPYCGFLKRDEDYFNVKNGKEGTISIDKEVDEKYEAMLKMVETMYKKIKTSLTSRK